MIARLRRLLYKRQRDENDNDSACHCSMTSSIVSTGGDLDFIDDDLFDCHEATVDGRKCSCDTLDEVPLTDHVNLWLTCTHNHMMSVSIET